MPAVLGKHDLEQGVIGVGHLYLDASARAPARPAERCRDRARGHGPVPAALAPPRKGSNTCGRTSAAILPALRTSIATLPGAVPSSASSTGASDRPCSSALATKFEITWEIRPGSGKCRADRRCRPRRCGAPDGWPGAPRLKSANRCAAPRSPQHEWLRGYSGPCSLWLASGFDPHCLCNADSAAHH